MSACSAFTEHVWKPGECKNCFKPKSLHCLSESSLRKNQAEQRPAVSQQQKHSSGVAGPNANLSSTSSSSQRGGSISARSGHFRPPVAKKPTIAVKPTMMFPCSSAGLDMEGNIHRPPDAGEPRKTSAFTVWNRNGLNRKRPCGSNNNEGEDAREEIEGYVQLSRHAPTGNNNNNGLTDMLKEIAGLSPGPDPSPGLCPGPGPGLGLGLCSGSKDLFFGRISSSYRRSLERGLPASSCLAMGSSGSGGPLQKRVALNDSTEVISTEGGRFCYPEFSSEGEDDNDEDEEEEEEESEENDDGEHESWDESDEELLAVEIRMRGQPRFANFRAATLSPVPFAAGKKWNTVPLRNRSLQRICAVDYDDSYDEILNGYPSMDSNRGHGLLTYGPGDLQSSAFLSNSESTTSPESSSSLPEDSRTTSSSGSSAPSGHRNGLPSQSSSQVHPPQAAAGEREQAHRALSPIKITETHKAVLAIRLEEQEGREGPMPQALPGQPITISFSPTEDQARPYRVVNLEKPLICKPYTVVDVSASMTHKEERTPDGTAKLKTHRIPTSPASPPSSPLTQPLSPAYAMSPTSPISPRSVPPSALGGSAFKKSGNIRYQEVWTSSTSPRQKIPRIDPEMGAAPVVPPRQCSHKSAPTSPISGLSSSRTVPVKSPNLSEIKFNSYNNAGMPLFPIIIRDEPSYARSSKNAVKVPIVINPSAYDNLAVYKSFLGLNGELPQPKGSRVASHTYEEIGSVESVQSSPTDKLPSSKAAVEDRKPTAAPASAPGLTPLEIFSKTTPASSSVPSMDASVTTAALTTSLTLTASLAKGSPNRDMSSREGSTDYPLVPGTGTAHREKAITVLSQIVASIQPPQSPPEPPSAQSQTCSVEELYALPPDATKDSLGRPKSLFSTPDSGLSKLRKDTPSKQLPKSQSASATVTLSSPKAEPSAPFPPPRSTSSPFHASNILQRHFGNWAKPASSSPTRPSDGESSPGGGEGRRGGAESTKPKRWISFKSFFRRRKDEEDQREKAEKDKGKTLGLDGTVIHMLPPPPIQRHHWFSEAKPDDPSQKPTIIFTYKPDCSASGDGEGELRVEESRETTLSAPEDSMGTRTLSPEQTLSPGQTLSPEQTLSPGQTLSPEQITSPQAPETDPPSHIISELPDRANEGTMPTAACRLAQLQLGSVGETCPPASDGSASVGDPDEDGNHSHSPASSTCSATYSNLGPSRANMIPLKQPRNMKSSFDTLASLDLDGPQDQPGPQATPPPLPKKCVPRSTTEPSSLAMPHGALKPKAEAKPGGSNLSVANPLYDLDCTWETTSQSSSLSSETRPHEQESGDSLERPVTGINKGRPANSLSCLASAPSATTGREHRGCRSAESLAGRTRTTGRGPGGRGSSKPQRQVLYRGMDSWEEVVGRIRGLHTETLRKLAVKCEDRFMAGLKEHLRFGNDSWSHFRLTTGTPCCEAGDAVYYTASYAKDPLVSYAIKICRSKVKETQQQFFHSLAVRQSLALHFNIQQDCGHFLADVPARLLPWEEEEEEEEDDEGEEEEQKTKNKETKTEKVGESDATSSNTTHNGQSDESHVMSHMGTTGQLRSRVVVITREVPFQTVADFVQEGEVRHARNPDLYERQVCLLLLQLCSGLEHMKPYHVTHCDLRLENLLLVHCQPGPPANPGQVEANNNTASSATGLSTAPCGTGLSTAPSGTGLTTAPSGTGLSTAPCGTGLTTATSAASVAANATCPARLIISNFSQAKQKTPLVVDPGALRNQSRLAPEIVTATQYRKCDEFQTGILIYEMLHQPNPFEETPDLKEREYTWADLPPLPVRSLYSQGLQQLASLLLTVNPSERIQMAEARACLQCLLWGPREDLFQVLNSAPAQGPGPGQRETTLQNWLDLKRTLMMIKFAERSLDSACGVSLEDWLCCQYLAFATTDSLSRVVHILQQTQAQPQPQPQPQPQAQPQPQPQAKHQTHPFHVTQSQPL